MARQPKSFFTPERRTLLEDLTGLSETDTAALELVGRYAAEKLWPQYEAINADRRAFHAAMDSLIDPKQLGFRGSFLPEDLGGIDLSIPAYMMGLEMLSQGNASVALSLAIDGSVLSALSRLGDEQQLGRYVRDALRDKRMTAFALTEPGYGSDAGNLETRATTDGASWKLNGQKTWTTNGGWADYYFVVCRTNPDRNLGPAGLSVLMVHKEEIATIEQIPKYTVPGSYTATLTFADSVVPAADGAARLVGSVDTGFMDAKRLLEGGRITIASFGLGIASEAFEMALDYTRTRESQGEALIEKQAIALPLAEFDARLDAARLMTYTAAKRMQAGRMENAEASKAKLLGSELAAELADFNRRVHGSYGLAKEYRCVQLIHDAGVAVTGEGTSEIQKILIASNRKKRTGKDPGFR